MKSNNNNIRLYALLYAILLISIAGTAVLLAFLPDRIPLHYDINGNIDRIGSKYEMLTFLAITTIFGVATTLFAKKESRKNQRSNEKTILYTTICIVSLFSALGLFLMVKSLNTTEPLDSESIGIFINIGIGIIFIVIGNIMPKARMNSVFGVRTPWSMANEHVWQKSQRFGGITLMICGAISILLPLFIRGLSNFLILVSLAMLSSILCVIASYRYYKHDFSNTNNK